MGTERNLPTRGGAGGGPREDGVLPWVRMLRLWALTSALCALASLPASSAFSVRELEVHGARALDPQRLLASAGLAPGVPLASVDPQHVRRRLLRWPWVEEAQVEVRWPSRVVVRVWERTPRAVLRLQDHTQVLVDGGGVVLERTSRPWNLPVVFAPALPWVLPGEAVPSTGVVQLVAELAALPEGERAQIRWARWLPGGDYAVGTQQGLVVRVSAGDLAWGLRAAREVARALHVRGVRAAVVDVRFRDRAVVQPAP